MKTPKLTNIIKGMEANIEQLEESNLHLGTNCLLNLSGLYEDLKNKTLNLEEISSLYLIMQGCQDLGLTQNLSKNNLNLYNSSLEILYNKLENSGLQPENVRPYIPNESRLFVSSSSLL